MTPIKKKINHPKFKKKILINIIKKIKLKIKSTFLKNIKVSKI